MTSKEKMDKLTHLLAKCLSVPSNERDAIRKQIKEVKAVIVEE